MRAAVPGHCSTDKSASLQTSAAAPGALIRDACDVFAVRTAVALGGDQNNGKRWCRRSFQVFSGSKIVQKRIRRPPAAAIVTRICWRCAAPRGGAEVLRQPVHLKLMDGRGSTIRDGVGLLQHVQI